MEVCSRLPWRVVHDLICRQQRLPLGPILEKSEKFRAKSVGDNRETFDLTVMDFGLGIEKELAISRL
jgi:hypothetical protein